ncbi:MAG: outer membrane beta-barrel protein [Cyclobacteriaceae bacterium]|nr:outer membrane beta-barrel protein [Cyclobacteriaceae bacterium]
MENSEKQKFEENWRAAFKDAEQNPSDRVWWSIDSALTHAEGGSMKRKIVFYKRLAAASVILALALAGSTTYFMNEKEQQLAVNTKQALEKTPLQNREANESYRENPVGTGEDDKLNTSKPDINIKNETSTGKEIQAGRLYSTNGNRSNAGNSLVAIIPSENEFEPEPVSTTTGQRFGMYAYDPLDEVYAIDTRLKGRMHEVTIVRKLPAMPASMMADSRRKSETKAEKLWAGIGAATGSYSYQGQGHASDVAAFSQANSLLNNSVQVSSNSSSRGSAYSLGLNMGTRLSDRWVLQGGIAYLNQSLDYTSNFAAHGPDNSIRAMVAEYSALKSDVTFSPTTSYQVNSVNELISVPVQAGYMLVNRKFGLQVNSGVATDMFIQNTLSDKSGGLKPYSESAGSESPYNTFSWAALAGTEFSYKIGRQYRVSLAPGLRYTLTPMMKSDQRSTPLMWDMGFRFRYIFN